MAYHSLRTMNLVDLAESIARKAHEGLFRRDGVTSYITHPERVVARLMAQGVTDERILAIAWLHDVLEDTDTDIEELKYNRLPMSVIQSVDILTKEEGQHYPHYLFGINNDSFARTVKIADILDNLSDAPTEKQIIKYAKALLYLHDQTQIP